MCRFGANSVGRLLHFAPGGGAEADVEKRSVQEVGAGKWFGVCGSSEGFTR